MDNLKILSQSFKMKGNLDDDYTLFEDGSILHVYDRHIYPNGHNVKEVLKVEDLTNSVKIRLLESASNENKKLVENILKLV